MTLSGLPPLPTFTIPTNRCSSLLLPLADIAEIMGKPMFIQVGIGEAAKSIHLVDLNVSWLHAPPDWPVLLSGVLYVLFGLALLFAPLIGALVLVTLAGVLAILFSVGLFAMAWRLWKA